MAKKGKNKKNKKKGKRVKKNYNKKEFCEVFCPTCLICTHPQADFCYTEMYKHEPKPFINKVFHNLIDLQAAYDAMGKSMKSMSVEQFQNVICRTGICHNGDVYASASCDSSVECYRLFMRQLGIGNAALIHELDAKDLIEFKNNQTKRTLISYVKKKKKKKKGRYVCASYPSFFSSDNEKFQTKVRKILYGDSDNQQDKDKELSSSDTGAADRHTEGGESEVHGSDSEGTLDWKP